MAKRPRRCSGAGREDRLTRSRRVASKPQSTSLRLGTGELTDHLGLGSRLIAYRVFVETLNRLTPELAADLAERSQTALDLIKSADFQLPADSPSDKADYLDL